MTITYRASDGAQVIGGTSLASPPFAAVAGGLIAVEMYHNTATGPTGVTDTAGNAYTILATVNDGTQYLTYAYCLSAAAHASNVITAAGFAFGNIILNFGHYTTDAAGFVFDKPASVIGGFGSTSIQTAAFDTVGAGVVCGGVHYNYPEACTLSQAGSLAIRSSIVGNASNMARGWIDAIYTSAQTGRTAGIASTASGRLGVYAASFTESGGGGTTQNVAGAAVAAAAASAAAAVGKSLGAVAGAQAAAAAALGVAKGLAGTAAGQAAATAAAALVKSLGGAATGQGSATGALNVVSGGTITTAPFVNDSGSVSGLLAGVTIEKFAVLRVSDMALVANWTSQTSDGAGVFTLTSGALVAGVDYLLVSCNADGSARGVKLYTAT